MRNERRLRQAQGVRLSRLDRTSIRSIELAEHSGDMSLDGAWADEEVCTNLRVRQSLTEERQHLPLAASEA